MRAMLVMGLDTSIAGALVMAMTDGHGSIARLDVPFGYVHDGVVESYLDQETAATIIYLDRLQRPGALEPYPCWMLARKAQLFASKPGLRLFYITSRPRNDTEVRHLHAAGVDVRLVRVPMVLELSPAIEHGALEREEVSISRELVRQTAGAVTTRAIAAALDLLLARPAGEPSTDTLLAPSEVPIVRVLEASGARPHVVGNLHEALWKLRGKSMAMLEADGRVGVVRYSPLRRLRERMGKPQLADTHGEDENRDPSRS